jgi:hypothetical protein
VVLAVLDYSKVFEIYIDASSKQLGEVITQDNWPIAFFSWKLSIAQFKYSVTKIELLAIVKTLKEFKWMLWGQSIKVLTDHKNLMRDALGLTLDQVYQLRLLLEEYGPKNVYIKGIHNTVADAISWLEYDPSVNQTTDSYFMTKVKNSKCSQRQNWMAVSKHWCQLEIDHNKHEDLNLVFVNHREEDESYPLITIEIAMHNRKTKNQRSIISKMQKHQKRTYVFILLKTQTCDVRMTN